MAHSKCSLNTFLNNQHCHHPHYYPHPEGRSGPACAKQSLAPLPAGEYPPPSHGLVSTAGTGPCRPLPPPLPLAQHTAVTWAVSCPSNTRPSFLPLALYTYLSSCLKCTSLTPVHSHPSHSKRPKSSVLCQTFFPQRCLPGTSLVVQWIRICLPRQGTRVRSRVWEDSTGSGTIKPGALQLLKPACPGACALQQEKPLQ